MRRRVVISGIGLISPLGLDRPTTWDGLLAGRSGVGPITKFDASDYSSRIAAEVRGFDPANFLDRKEARKMDTFTHYAVAATREALDDAVRLDPAVAHDLAERLESLGFSGRAYVRVLRLARTIADVAGREEVLEEDLLEAIQYRSLDRAT